jgi:hypothetical protein
VTARGRDLALRTQPLTVHRERQIRSRTQNDLISAPWRLIAEQPPTVQIGGSARYQANQLLLRSVTGYRLIASPGSPILCLLLAALDVSDGRADPPVRCCAQVA